MGNRVAVFKKHGAKSLPIDTTFRLPAPVPTWPPGGEFASGSIDLGGLQVCQISNLSKVWATHEGGPGNLGATFFEPSPIPQGYFPLGFYAQPNNKPLFGWVLAAKDAGDDDDALKQPLDYTLVWTSEALKIKQDGNGYIWLPTPPDGYKAVGHVVTTTPQKPPLDKIRCVRSDLTDVTEINDTLIWSSNNGFNVYGLRPATRGIHALGVETGTFIIAPNNNNGDGRAAGALSLACLKNVRSDFSSAMPNLDEIKTLVQSYAPRIYFHPDESYLPSSVRWFFDNGALLYTKGQETNPVPIDSPAGSNLPSGGSNDGQYWLDLPVDPVAKDRVKKGDLKDAEVYLHVKPMMGATFTDIAIWIFYPFNGPAKAKVEFINIDLGKIGEHVGDWEHLTLRISNFNGELKRIYFSQHSKGEWVDAPELEFENGKPVAYSSLHGHSMYRKAGLVLQGGGGVGIRNDTARSNLVMDSGAKYAVVGVEYLGPDSKSVVEPAWLNYAREWGPKITYNISEELEKVERVLLGSVKKAFDRVIKSLPDELFGEEGPTGPKWKDYWVGDERS